MSVLLAFLHFLAVGSLSMVLAAQWAALRGAIDTTRLRLLSRLDLAYLVLAVLVLATGLARAFWGDKPWAYYASNPFFHSKLAVFLLIGGISVMPTLRFMGWKRQAAAQSAWRVSAHEQASVQKWVRAELLLLPLLPLLGVLMARGVPQL